MLVRLLVQRLGDLFSRRIQRFFEACLPRETACNLVREDLLRSIGLRTPDAPHLTFGGNLVGMLQRFVDRSQPGLGGFAAERGLARRERADKRRIDAFALLGRQPLDKRPCGLELVGLAADAGNPDTTMGSGP